MISTAEVVQHYGQQDLKEGLKAALGAAGLAEGRLSPSDLAPLDQFHTRGLAATVELAQAAGIKRGTTVLDIGSGLGGPSRYLAATFGCRAHGVGLTPSFADAARFPPGPASLHHNH